MADESASILNICVMMPFEYNKTMTYIYNQYIYIINIYIYTYIYIYICTISIYLCIYNQYIHIYIYITQPIKSFNTLNLSYAMKQYEQHDTCTREFVLRGNFTGTL